MTPTIMSNKIAPGDNIINKVVVIGTGVMGAGIAQVAVEAGMQVVIVGRTQEKCDNVMSKLSVNIHKTAKKKLSNDLEAQEKFISSTLQNLEFTTELFSPHLDDADMVIEAIVENLKVKQKLFADLEKVVSSHCLLVTNTSSFLLNDVSTKMQKLNENFGGLHFFNPVSLMKLVEVIRAPNTSDNTYECLIRFCQQIGKSPVKCKDSPGFIVNRLIVPYLADAARLAERGEADIKEIDTAMRLGAGYPMGPFELMDYIGLDVLKFIMDGWHQSYPEDDRFIPCASIEKLVANNKLGRKTGEGFYRYAK